MPTAQLKSRKADELRLPPAVMALEGEEEAEAPLSCCGLAPAPPATTKLSDGRRRSTRAVGHETTVRLLLIDIAGSNQDNTTTARLKECIACT